MEQFWRQTLQQFVNVLLWGSQKTYLLDNLMKRFCHIRVHMYVRKVRERILKTIRQLNN